MATKLNNSKAEDAFTELLESKYGLIEGWLDDSGEVVGGHFVREHTFKKKFASYEERDGRRQEEQYGTRVDFWFPQWKIVVEFKAAPLGRHAGSKAHARLCVEALAKRGRSVAEQHVASWSNQMSKFKGIAEQANEQAETYGILWILVDDTQMSPAPGNMKRYTLRKLHQVEALRETHSDGYGWNPMRSNECGRLLWMFKEVSELTGRGVYDQMCGFGTYDGLTVFEQVGWNVRVSNTIREIVPKLHTLDTFEGLHLVLGYEPVPNPDGLALADGEKEPEAGELVKAITVPFLVPPQK
jgi:hypothetical protein